MRKNAWKTKPIDVARSPASWRSSRSATSVPATETRPLDGRSRVPITCSSVDFPEPDGPTRSGELDRVAARSGRDQRGHRDREGVLGPAGLQRDADRRAVDAAVAA